MDFCKFFYRISGLPVIVLVTSSLFSCNNSFDMGTFGYDSDFFSNNGIETIELSDGKDALVMVVPAYQGRVMTSSAAGRSGKSFGWINYKHISSGEILDNFNPFGGEERFWFGPEGGKYSWFFKKGDEQVYSNWKVPSVMDTDVFSVVEKTGSSVVLEAETKLVNASDVEFNIGVRRSVRLLSDEDIKTCLGTGLGKSLKCVAYSTENTIINKGNEAWDEQTGMPSVWMLGMFNPTETTTVFIPYNEDGEGVIVNDEYFGKVPSDRLIIADGLVKFRIDGKMRTKIGLPAGRAKDICGSYDSEGKVLTIMKFTLPEGDKPYLNGQWGDQQDAFNGDVINSYNDGPTETGTIMGPFYEIETSSPGADLKPGESLSHSQYVMHIQGEEEELAVIVEKLFGVGIDRIKNSFQK